MTGFVNSNDQLADILQNYFMAPELSIAVAN